MQRGDQAAIGHQPVTDMQRAALGPGRIGRRHRVDVAVLGDAFLVDGDGERAGGHDGDIDGDRLGAQGLVGGEGETGEDQREQEVFEPACHGLLPRLQDADQVEAIDPATHQQGGARGRG